MNEPINLNDIIEMKKCHPCSTRSKLFEVVRLGADVKIKCLGCDKIMMLDRDAFNCKVKRVYKKADSPIQNS